MHSLGSDLSVVISVRTGPTKLGKYELEPTRSLIFITFVTEGKFTTSYKEQKDLKNNSTSKCETAQLGFGATVNDI